MQPPELPEPWHSFLMELDRTLSEEVSLHCMGGFVVSLLYRLQRTTSDIDVLLMITLDKTLEMLSESGGEGSELHTRYGVYLYLVTVSTVPENYEERLTEMFPGAFQHLRRFALDLYELALSKLERNRQRDRDDVKYLAKTVPFDFAILKDRYQKE